VLRTVNDQSTLWDAILPPELLVLPVELGRVDALLDDPAFFAPFRVAFDARIGRPSIPMETWPRPTDLPRARCVGSRLDSTPGNGVEPQWNATIRTTRGVGRLFDSLKLWAWQLAPSWLPHCRGRWPDSGKQGRAPSLSGPSIPG